MEWNSFLTSSFVGKDFATIENKRVESENKFNQIPMDKSWQGSNYIYQVGSSLGINASCYVEREADRILYEALHSGQFCYVF